MVASDLVGANIGCSLLAREHLLFARARACTIANEPYAVPRQLPSLVGWYIGLALALSTRRHPDHA